MGAEGQAESPASELRVGRQGDHRRHQPGSERRHREVGGVRLHEPVGVGREDHGEGKDASGKVVPIAVDAKLENIGAYMRHLHGTWTRRAARRVSSPSLATD